MHSSAVSLYAKRRTQYIIGNDLPISEFEAETLIQNSIRLAPSAFNSQSSRAVTLFGQAHEKFWAIAQDALRPLVQPDAFVATAAKLAAFAKGSGTVLFFEDQDVVTKLQRSNPLYAESFPVWSEQSAGMAQFAVWNALSEVNIGASLQHYNPLVDQEVTKQWHLPPSWRLRAQMPFGSNLRPFSEKSFIADELRFRTYR